MVGHQNFKRDGSRRVVGCADSEMDDPRMQMAINK